MLKGSSSVFPIIIPRAPAAYKFYASCIKFGSLLQNTIDPFILLVLMASDEVIYNTDPETFMVLVSFCDEQNRYLFVPLKFKQIKLLFKAATRGTMKEHSFIAELRLKQ
jgi:hypothetical protein